MNEMHTLIARNASGNTEELIAQLIHHDGGWLVG